MSMENLKIFSTENVDYFVLAGSNWCAFSHYNYLAVTEDITGDEMDSVLMLKHYFCQQIYTLTGFWTFILAIYMKQLTLVQNLGTDSIDPIWSNKKLSSSFLTLLEIFDVKSRDLSNVFKEKAFNDCVCKINLQHFYNSIFEIVVWTNVVCW